MYDYFYNVSWYSDELTFTQKNITEGVHIRKSYISCSVGLQINK